MAKVILIFFLLYRLHDILVKQGKVGMKSRDTLRYHAEKSKWQNNSHTKWPFFLHI